MMYRAEQQSVESRLICVNAPGYPWAAHPIGGESHGEEDSQSFR